MKTTIRLTKVTVITAALFSVISLGFASHTSAQTYTPAEQELRTKLFAMIADLQQLILTLQATQTNPATVSDSLPNYTFTDTDKAARGSEGEHVRQLQKALNKLGYVIAGTGDGSPGKETNYFGPATELALKRFQAAQGIVSSGTPESTGYGAFGPSTRAKLNTLLAQATNVPQGDNESDDEEENDRSTTDEIEDEEEEEDNSSSSSSSGGGGSSSNTSTDTTCTSFTYSDWNTCQPDSTQTRSVLTSSPNSCTGGSPVTTQSCTYTPPVNTCTSFTYSAWGSCQSDNTQTRTVTDSSPDSCTGGDPVLTQSCTYVPPAPPSGDDPYDLSGFDIPFSYSWPTAPTITSEVTVTPGTLDENIVDGRRVILSPGTYDFPGINTVDQEFVLQPGVVIDSNLLFNSSAQRIVIRSEVPRQAQLLGRIFTDNRNNNQDLLIDGIDQDARNISDSRNGFHGQRVAVINSRLQVQDFVISSFPNSNASTQSTDLIVANNDMLCSGSTQACVRIQNQRSIILADNRIIKQGSGHHVLRIHNPIEGMQTEFVWVSNNQFQGQRLWWASSASSATVLQPIGSSWLENNQVYWNDGVGGLISMGHVESPDRNPNPPEFMSVTGNEGFGAFSTWMPGELEPGWIMNNNTISPYESPAAWSHNN